MPLLKGHCRAGPLVGSLSVWYVYIFPDQSTCSSPGVVEMQILPRVGLRACISIIPGHNRWLLVHGPHCNKSSKALFHLNVLHFAQCIIQVLGRAT